MISVDKIDCFVPSSRPLLSIPDCRLSDVERQIGEHVASLIPDGATIHGE
ncbi:hypothetical protein QFZ28_002559 [Neobacillus niacini]|nr:hypothetical protein [Neobacillus niacini]MDQ1002159.1 hypothetical protein [Neobacillus niacini]